LSLLGATVCGRPYQSLIYSLLQVDRGNFFEPQLHEYRVSRSPSLGSTHRSTISRSLSFNSIYRQETPETSIASRTQDDALTTMNTDSISVGRRDTSYPPQSRPSSYQSPSQAFGSSGLPFPIQIGNPQPVAPVANMLPPSVFNDRPYPPFPEAPESSSCAQGPGQATRSNATPISRAPQANKSTLIQTNPFLQGNNAPRNNSSSPGKSSRGKGPQTRHSSPGNEASASSSEPEMRQNTNVSRTENQANISLQGRKTSNSTLKRKANGSREELSTGISAQGGIIDELKKKMQRVEELELSVEEKRKRKERRREEKTKKQERRMEVQLVRAVSIPLPIRKHTYLSAGSSSGVRA
jgi:hypothetical protein